LALPKHWLRSDLNEAERGILQDQAEMTGKSALAIRTVAPGDYEVLVRDHGSETRHRVTLSADQLQRLGGGKSTAEQCLTAAFRFLLDREPKESILRAFDIAVISRYFPEFERSLPQYLDRGP
jgi:hypothetical protein